MFGKIVFLSILIFGWDCRSATQIKISKITITNEELVIKGAFLENIRAASIADLENKTLKEFQIANATPEKVVAKPLDGVPTPADKDLKLVISNLEGELFYPITLISREGLKAVYKISKKENPQAQKKIVVDEKSEINFSPSEESDGYDYNYSFYANQVGVLAIKNNEKDLLKIDDEGNLEIAGSLKIKGKEIIFNGPIYPPKEYPPDPSPSNQGMGFLRISNVIISETNNIFGVVEFTSSGNMDVATGTFHVDSATNRVGIGMNNPTYKLDVQGGANSGIRLKQTATSTNTSGAFFNGMVFEDPGLVKAYAIGYGAGDLFTINSFDGTAYRNIFSINNLGDGRFSGTLKIGPYTLPNVIGSSGEVLTTNGSGGTSWQPKAAGDVIGPASSTIDNVVSFSSTNGKNIKDSGTNTANLPTMAVVATAPNQIIISAGVDKQLTTTLYPIPATIGASGTYLISDGTNATWQLPTGTLLSGGNITGAIVTSSQNAIQVGPSGANTGEVRYIEQSGADYVGFKAPNSVTKSVVWALPSSEGSPGSVLSTDGSGTLSWASPGTLETVKAQTGTTYTLVSGDCGNTITFNNASPIIVTAPALTAGCKVEIIQIGTGQVTVSGSGATVNNSFGLFKTRTQHSVLYLKYYTNNSVVLTGDVN